MIARYFGLDIHKQYVVAVAVDATQAVAYPNTRFPMDKLVAWAAEHLTAQDEVALEVTTNSWPVVDLLRQHAGRVVVVDPYKTKLIAQARIKNDKVDALVLAKLLAAGFTCEVWVPPEPVREQRALAAHRANLQKQCTRIKNRIHNLVRRHNLRCPEKSLFSANGRAWLCDRSFPLVDKLQAQQLLQQLDLLQAQLDEADRLVAQQAVQDPRIARLLQVTGIGYFTAFALLAVIGDIQRFPSPNQLTSYAGLVPRQHQSGRRNFHGHITKAGSRLVRWLMVEAARSAIRRDPHWRRFHAHVARRRGSNIATVAVARKLLATVWHLLQEDTLYYYLQTQTFVTKLQQWAYRIGREQLPAASAKEFVCDQLCQLGLEPVARSLVPEKRSGRLRVRFA